jgi:chorismate mutase/prephenate dehydratase
MSSLPSDLANRRAEIDRFDREIHRLLIERAKVVHGVMRAKAAATAAGEVTPPFRPGREAEVLRGLLARHASEFPVASLLQIWREIVSGATRMQAVQQVAVLKGERSLWDLARDHFGVGAEYRECNGTAEIFGLLRQMQVAAGVLPIAVIGQPGQWWCTQIAEPSPQGAPKVVARLPFFPAGISGAALVLSPFAADASSNDRGIVGVELTAGADPDCIRPALPAAGLPPVSPPIQAGPYLWVEVGRLLRDDDAVLTALAQQPQVQRAVDLGGYAVPLA